jgi:hypothetical protein
MFLDGRALMGLRWWAWVGGAYRVMFVPSSIRIIFVHFRACFRILATRCAPDYTDIFDCVRSPDSLTFHFALRPLALPRPHHAGLDQPHGYIS